MSASDRIHALDADEEALLQAECRLRMVRYLAAEAKGANKPPSIDIFIEGFWACFDAIKNPRPREDVERDLEMHLRLHAARAAGLVK